MEEKTMKKTTKIQGKIPLNPLLSFCLLGCLVSCSEDLGDGANSEPNLNVNTESSTTASQSLLLQRDSLALGAYPLYGDTGDFRQDYDSLYYDSSAELVEAFLGGAGAFAFVSPVEAAVLYNEGAEISLLAVGSYANLSLVSCGVEVHNLSELQGETVYLLDTGGNTDVVFQKLLLASGVNPQGDVVLVYGSLESIQQKLADSGRGICVLAEPYASQVLEESGAYSLNLSSLWGSMVGSVLPMGCVIAHNDFIAEQAQVVEDFLQDYEESIAFMKEEEALALLLEEGYFPRDALWAEEAYQGARLGFSSGEEMQYALQSFYVQLFRENPQFVGGGLPYDEFYEVSVALYS